MSTGSIHPSAILDSKRQLVDVRTPAEFSQGHIPTAKNLPLFSDEERAIVGTLYKNEGRGVAFKKGLDFVGPKLSVFVDAASAFSSEGKLLLYCWRGGMRSGSLKWLLSSAGLDVVSVRGGYKAIRKYRRDYLEEAAANFLVLGGATGSGKTDVLHALAKEGEQLIDLEGLAHHKGSAFGALGEKPQPTSEHFENKIADIFCRLDLSRRIWIENESRMVGRAHIYDSFWDKKISAALIELEIPLPQRVENLVKGYSGFSVDDLSHAFMKIERRLGGKNKTLAIAAVESGRFVDAAKIALAYYDKTYSFATARQSFSKRSVLSPKSKDTGEIAQELIEHADEHGY